MQRLKTSQQNLSFEVRWEQIEHSVSFYFDGKSYYVPLGTKHLMLMESIEEISEVDEIQNGRANEIAPRLILSSRNNKLERNTKKQKALLEKAQVLSQQDPMFAEGENAQNENVRK